MVSDLKTCRPRFVSALKIFAYIFVWSRTDLAMLVCSLIVRTYTPAAVGRTDEMNTLAQREAETEAKVRSQRVSTPRFVGLDYLIWI